MECQELGRGLKVEEEEVGGTHYSRSFISPPLNGDLVAGKVVVYRAMGFLMSVLLPIPASILRPHVCACNFGEQSGVSAVTFKLGMFIRH